LFPVNPIKKIAKVIFPYIVKIKTNAEIEKTGHNPVSKKKLAKKEKKSRSSQ
jgi:hypothetical protein